MVMNIHSVICMIISGRWSPKNSFQRVNRSMLMSKTKQVLIEFIIEYIEKYSLSIMRDSVQAQIEKFL